MRIERLHLVDFRGFAEAEIRFEADLNVLVGVNAAGKSSILDAVAIVLSDPLVRASGKKPRGFADTDIRSGASELWCEAAVAFGGEASSTWSVRHVRRGRKAVRAADGIAAEEWALEVRKARTAGTLSAEPLAVFYPTDRTVLDVPGKIGTKHDFDAINAMDEALEARTADFRMFFEWFRNREDIENERRARELQDHRDPALEAVRTAIRRFLPGVTDPRVQRAPQRFVVTKAASTLEVDQLSAGERSIIALVGDLARRMAMASTGPNPLEGAAIVLVDELEIHLHPALQRDLLRNLRATFPNVQFIVTTHSAHVLSEVEARSVRLLRDFHVEQPPIETYGREEGTIVREVQGAPTRPREVAASIDAAGAAIDARRFDDAEKHLVSLRAVVGPADPEVIRLEALLDLLVEPAS